VNIVVGLPIALLISYLGYREAAKHQAQYGKPPWNVSPILWALIVFATGLIVGGILLWAARRSDRKGHAAPQVRVTSRSGRPGSVL
jgi:H+/Cl- antiporter ClcA